MATHRLKQFRVGDLFDIHPTKTYKGNNSDLFDDKGKNPVLGNTSTNNGIGGYSSKPCTENGGIITFSDTTTADAIFYQPKPFIGYSHVQGMYPYSDKWSEKSLLYFLTVFKKIAIESGFDYANKFNRKIASEFIVTLPVKCSCVMDISAIMSIGGGGIEMSKIDTSTWKEFHIGDIFDVKSSKKKFNACDVAISEEGYPYVVRTSANNGIRGYINEDPKYLNDGNTISFGQDTATMFYQPKPYFTGDKIKILQFKNGILNEQSAQFFLTVMRKAFSDFSWGISSFDENIIKGVSIYLPVTEVEEIDFEYMEERIKELEAERIKELEAALRVMELHDTKLTKDEEKALHSSPTLKEFRVGDLFDLQGVRQAKSQKDIPNDVNGIPYVVQSQFNNMVTRIVNEQYLINHDEPVCDGNCIVLGVTLPAISYQPQKFGASQVITARANFLNEEVGQYFVMLFKKLSQQFSYQNKPGLQKYKDMMVMLPVDSCGEPDFVYMKNYIRAIEKQTIRKLYDDKGILIDATKNV